MARRAGKAARRKARQRGADRSARTTSRPQRPVEPSLPPSETEKVPPVGTPDAREAASLAPPPRATPSPLLTRDSSLTDRQRTEYHYVERELRSIALLTAVMFVLLLVAWFGFQALDLTATV